MIDMVRCEQSERLGFGCEVKARVRRVKRMGRRGDVLAALFIGVERGE
jgi:hypothetical protein